MSAVMEPPKPIWRANRGGQWAFLACPYWECLADGDRGGGKTTALLVCFLSHVGKGYGPDWRGVIFRPTYPQLKDIVDISRVLIPKAYPGARFNKVEHEWEFESGEVLLFRPLENLKSYDSFHGHAYPFMGFEEATGWPNSEAYEAMLSCSRRRSARTDVPKMVRLTTNPFGVGHQWLKSRFITGKQPFVPYGDEGEERIRIPVLWRHNKAYVASDPGYHKRIASTLTNEAQRKAWLENSWDIVAGGRFSDIWTESIHVMEPFNIPMGWRVDRSHDWGSSAPFDTRWYAESNGEKIEDGRSWPKGTIFVIHEDYGCEGDMHSPNWKPNIGLRLTPLEIAERTKQHETHMREWGLIKKQPQPGPADDNLFDVSHGRSMASIMSAPPYQIVWNRASKGPGSRVTGWQLLEDRLKASRQKPMEHPGIFIFNTCKHLIRTLPLAPRDPKKQEDIEFEEDHCFHGDTLIETSYGIVPIGNLVGTNGYIFTRKGWQPYQNCRMTREKQELVKVTFDDGFSVICTRDHQFLTTKGWKQAVDLMDSFCYHIQKKEYMKWKSRSSVILSKSLMANDTTYVDSISKKMASDFIEKFGSTTMEISPKGVMFTTKMKIAPITISKTSNYWYDQSICHYTHMQENLGQYPNRHVMQQQIGIGVVQGGDGIYNISKRAREIYGLKPSFSNASDVEKHITQKTLCDQSLSIVQETVSKGLATQLQRTIYKEYAVIVNPLLQSINITRQYVAKAAQVYSLAKPVSIISYGSDNVYCLTVPSTGDFCLPSGAIVKNCLDSLRYRLLAHGGGNVVRGVSL